MDRRRSDRAFRRSDSVGSLHTGRCRRCRATRRGCDNRHTQFIASRPECQRARRALRTLHQRGMSASHRAARGAPLSTHRLRVRDALPSRTTASRAWQCAPRIAAAFPTTWSDHATPATRRAAQLLRASYLRRAKSLGRILGHYAVITGSVDQESFGNQSVR